jgi:hypothetical protein
MWIFRCLCGQPPGETVFGCFTESSAAWSAPDVYDWTITVIYWVLLYTPNIFKVCSFYLPPSTILVVGSHLVCLFALHSYQVGAVTLQQLAPRLARCLKISAVSGTPENHEKIRVQLDRFWLSVHWAEIMLATTCNGIKLTYCSWLLHVYIQYYNILYNYTSISYLYWCVNYTPWEPKPAEILGCEKHLLFYVVFWQNPRYFCLFWKYGLGTFGYI